MRLDIEDIMYNIEHANNLLATGNSFFNLPSLIDTLKMVIKLERENAELRTALEEINREELNAQRPGGGYSRSAILSYNALKKER